MLLSPTIARSSLPLGEVRMDGSMGQYQQALEPMDTMTLGQIDELYAADTEKYAKVIRDAGIKRAE